MIIQICKFFLLFLLLYVHLHTIELINHSEIDQILIIQMISTARDRVNPLNDSCRYP